MRKRNRNLSLDPSAVERAERYSELHKTNVSQLVNDYLSGLRLHTDDATRDLSPAVRRLLGIAGSGEATDYHNHLVEKYGS
jgi:hypothetical protein